MGHLGVGAREAAARKKVAVEQELRFRREEEEAYFEESIPVEESIPGVERNIVEERIAGDEERVAADLDKYGCLPCGMKFRYTPNLKRHVGLVHEVRKQPVMCPKPCCKAQFFYPG